MKNENLTVQKEIVKLIEEIKKEVAPKGKKWKKYYGDVCVRIFREFILREIPSEYTVSSPNAYIKDFPTEFDLLVVDKNSSPIKHTNAYFPEKVKCGFEVKAHGIF
ncbi:MAG: hypothetical protein AB1779_00335 [Candidatus Thermoplasmatota archaeon]